MGERKVLNKYYPPDFDPALLIRNKCPKDRQVKVRVMLPFSMQCNTCGEYIYRGKKFNSRKELVQNEDYLGIKIWRFYVKCTRCCSEVTFKTDPKNADYICEAGATRNFEPWRQEHEVRNLLAQEKEEDEKKNTMKALENRTIESKREIEMQDALEALKERNDEVATMGLDDLIEETVRKRNMTEAELDKQDDEEAMKAFGGAKRARAEALGEIETTGVSDDSDQDAMIDDTAEVRAQAKSLFAAAAPSALLTAPVASSSSANGSSSAPPASSAAPAPAPAVAPKPAGPAKPSVMVIAKKKGDKPKKHKVKSSAAPSSAPSTAAPTAAAPSTTPSTGLLLGNSYADDSD